MNSYWTRMYKNMDKKSLFEAGIVKKPQGYEILKMFSPLAFVGSGGRFDALHVDKKGREADGPLIQRFYQAFPALRMMPQTRYATFEFGNPAPQQVHPISTYLKKYKALVGKGYTDDKAFSIVHAELTQVFESQRENMRILRGGARALHGDSYLDRAQRVAELESQLKMQRTIRDMPKYERYNDQNQEWLQENSLDAQSSEQEQEFAGRTSIEDVLALKSKGSFASESYADYEPVLYKVVKDKQAEQQRQSLTQIQEGFIERSEKLLRLHQQRSHIHDGLKNLSDRDIMAKVTESPTTLKRRSKGFLNFLKRYRVRLDQHGDIDYSGVNSVPVQNILQQNESLVKVVLMQADLEFEYPQKLEKMMIKSDILKWLDEEEDKLRQLISVPVILSDAQASLPPMPDHEGPVLTIEDYYSIPDDITRSLTQQKRTIDKTKISYEQFVQENASENIFDNDLLEQQYKFWESLEDKEIRLRQIWIDLKRQNALGGLDAVSKEDTQNLNEEIVQLMRRVRWKVDQELTRRNEEPLFKDLYANKYDKEEFLLDVDIEFFKIKKLLEKNPKALKDDPVLSVDYLKMINLIKQQKMVEDTNEAFSAESAYKRDWHDPTLVEKLQKDREQKALDNFMRNQMLDDMGAGSQNSAAMEVDNQALQMEEDIKSTKRKEAKEKQKIVMQFDKMVTAFERTKGEDSTVKVAQGRSKTLKAETAGMLKKKNKVKKEKTLKAKLKLKERKGKSGK